jgi:signal transduction histidine kinase/DNA-binding response OmpR family regulator/HPt (histidine-containing phosphotransfer) domain-containing protein
MNKATILIVEDEGLVAKDLSGKLANLGYEVVGISAAGEEVVALACRLRPSLVLMDIWLKGPMDGIKAAEAIQQQYDVPIVYLTAHSDSATLARAKVTGPFGYILKPFDERDLATQIELALCKHQAEKAVQSAARFPCENPHPVIRIDRGGTVLYANRSSAALGDEFRCVMGCPAPETFARLARQALADGRTAEAEIETRGRVFSFVFAPISGSSYVNLYGRDNTERKRAEEELRQAKAAAEAANEAKTRFLANISHELRTPMNAILGMVDLALPRQVDATAADFLRTAKESADLLMILVNDLLDCAKIEAGKLKLESAPFSLRRAMEQIAQVLTVQARRKGVGFSCGISPDVPDALVGDQVRLQQILLHLGGNGVKFTERGAVAVSVSAESQDADQVCLGFAVRDTGIGISPADLDQVFRPFTQADSSTSRRFGGNGLGLSIASKLINLMGGSISAESEPGQGSTFRFTVWLAVAKQLAGEPKAHERPVATTATLRILLVEDNPANQKVAALLLKRRGHKVDIAGDGRQGLCMAQQNQYDAILMDVQMPVMDGLEATKAIRALEDGHGRVPIIAVTAHAIEEDREDCLAAGMDGYLTKPINARELFAILERVAGGAPIGPKLSRRAAVAAAVPVFNPELALERCSESPQLLREMIQCFRDDIKSLLPQMKAALQAGDLVQVGRLGHRLKGTIVYLGAAPAAGAAQRVAYFSQNSGEQAEVEEAVKSLERECEALNSSLNRHPIDLSPEAL